MVTTIPKVEPFTFQASTAFDERVQLADKLNEIVDTVNELDVEEITKDISALESEVSTQGNEIDAINTEIAGLPTKTDVNNGDITAVAIDKTSEGIEIQLTRPAGVLDDSVALPFINTATLIPTSTERAFKIRFTYTDGTQYDTNEFVIPEGGGTDVSVTGVTVEDGTAPNSFKVAIQLSDASTIASNDYEIDIPAQQNTYPTSVSGTLSGTTLTLTIGLNNSTNVTGTADLSTFLTKSEASSTYATKTEVTAVDTKVTAIGVTSEGNNVSVNGKSATIVKSISGQVTDGNLKITVNGVESGDIPLPKNEPGVLIINTSINLPRFYVDITSNIIPNSSSTITNFIGQHTFNNDDKSIYVCGEKFKSVIKSTTIDVYIFTSYINNMATYKFTGDITVNPPTHSNLEMALEDGNYKMPIDIIASNEGMTISRKADIEAPDNEYLIFSITNHKATFDTNPISLNPENFICQGNYQYTRILILHDRIIKNE